MELEDFPGGYEIFSVVADFCYNLKPSFSRHNVIATCCAACMLKMSGVGNLCDVAEQFLQVVILVYDTLSTFNFHCKFLNFLHINCP